MSIYAPYIALIREYLHIHTFDDEKGTWHMYDIFSPRIIEWIESQPADKWYTIPEYRDETYVLSAELNTWFLMRWG